MRNPWHRQFAVPAALGVLLAVVHAGIGTIETEGALAIVLRVASFAILIWLVSRGADWVVDGAAGLARRLGISELVIGLSVVAFGTSAPEMAASVVAGLRGSGDITVANVIGSNIFNMYFILGAVALFTAGGVHIARPLVKRDGPILLLGTVLALVALGHLPGATRLADGSTEPVLGTLLNMRLDFIEGLALLLGLAVYIWLLYIARRDTGGRPATQQPSDGHWIGEAVYLIVGLVMVVGGCQYLIGYAEPASRGLEGFGALWFAYYFSIPEYVIGITIVAAGTSAPELVVSLAAARHGSADMSVGNLLGSSVFNIFGVLGIAGVLLQPPIAASVIVSHQAALSMAVMCLILVVILIFMYTGRRLSRLEGGILVLFGLGQWLFDLLVRR
jgi:cation:H+ antiporter